MADNPSKATKSTRYASLVERLNRYRDAYYNRNVSLVTDKKYDKLYRELVSLETDYPHLKVDSSPTNHVGFPVEAGRTKLKHPYPMLSLDNVFNTDELSKFINKCSNKVKATEYYLDGKIDGLALELIYRNGKLISAITRGDGVYGEDVFVNAATIVNIPKTINTGATISVRGEVSAHRETFNQVNERLESEGKSPFSHIRNYAAGSLRHKDPEVTKSRQLKFYAWECISNPMLNRDVQMNTLVKLGFNISNGKLCKSPAEVEDYIYQYSANRTNYSYPIDGVVIKVNDVTQCDTLGCSSRAPKWAVAWKFTDKGSDTIIKNIHWQIGRTGKLTPVATLDTVNIDGANISEVTLHNADYILRKNIGIGAEVVVVRRGDVIPKIQEIISHGEKVVIPEVCPICGHETILAIRLTTRELRCSNHKCPGIFKAFLVYLTSKEVFDIKGIGPAVIADLMASDVTTFLDLFHPINAKNPNQQIIFDKLVTRTRSMHLTELLMILGISGMGKAMASKLSSETRTLKELSTILDDKSMRQQIRLTNMVRTNLINWWDVPTNRQFVQDLLKLDLPNL